MRNFAVFLKTLFWTGFILLFLGFIHIFVPIVRLDKLSIIGLYVVMVSPVSIAFYVCINSLKQREYLLAVTSLLLILILVLNVIFE